MTSKICHRNIPEPMLPPSQGCICRSRSQWSDTRRLGGGQIKHALGAIKISIAPSPPRDCSDTTATGERQGPSPEAPPAHPSISSFECILSLYSHAPSHTVERVLIRSLSVLGGLNARPAPPGRRNRHSKRCGHGHEYQQLQSQTDQSFSRRQNQWEG